MFDAASSETEPEPEPEPEPDPRPKSKPVGGNAMLTAFAKKHAPPAAAGSSA